MKRIIAIVTIGFFAWMAYKFPYEMLNPGALIKGHQNIKTKCLECHNPFWGISSEKCIGCHKLSEIGKDSIKSNDTTSYRSKISFHVKFANQECTSCHTDHKGVKPSISVSKFSHELLSSAEKTNCSTCHNKPNDEIHKQIASSCNSCHSTQGWKSSVSFNHEMIQGADKNNCTSCHQPPKETFHNQFNNNCEKCHSTSKWKPSSFDHSSYFQLDQNHNTNCVTCHVNNNFRSYTCYGCHEHSQGNISNKHHEERISDLSNCVRCHKSGNEHESEESEHGEHEGHGEHDDD